MAFARYETAVVGDASTTYDEAAGLCLLAKIPLYRGTSRFSRGFPLFSRVAAATLGNRTFLTFGNFYLTLRSLLLPLDETSKPDSIECARRSSATGK